VASEVTPRRWSTSAPRWALAIILGAVWLLAMAHFGVPALVLGLVLLAAWRARDKRTISWPVMTGVGAFLLIAVLVAPWSCTGIVAISGSGHTECSNPLGIPYSGGGGYNAPLWPALTAGLSAGLTAASVTWLALRGHPRVPSNRRSG
jgi:hypothetical protein